CLFVDAINEEESVEEDDRLQPRCSGISGASPLWHVWADSKAGRAPGSAVIPTPRRAPAPLHNSPSDEVVGSSAQANVNLFCLTMCVYGKVPVYTCDETKPTCLQCQKSRRQCPGYKDDFDLVFRNETQATERRARRAVVVKKVNSRALEPAQDQDLLTSSTHVKQEYDDVSTDELALQARELMASFVTGTVAVPVEQQAPCYFLANFVLMPKENSPGGYFDFLIPMIKTERPDSVIFTAFEAVAMASLVNRPNTKASGLIHLAFTKYAQALRLTNLALQNQAQQKEDATLAAVLLLGLFESIASERGNVLAWGAHVDGAVQLVKLRGKKQLRTKVGNSLFNTVRNQMIVSCMAASKQPALGIDWWISDDIKDENAKFVAMMSIRVAELRTGVNHILAASPRTPANIEKVLAVMRQAQAMEQEFQDWHDSLPDAWRPKTVAWIENIPDGDLVNAELCPGRVDMFDDFFIAYVWNHARTARIFLSGMVIRCTAWVCAPVDYRTTPEYATAARVGIDIVTDIIASAPYFLGWRVDKDGNLKHAGLGGFACGDDEDASPRSLGGYFCQWGLLSVAGSDFTTDAQRIWAKGRLRYIGDNLGMNQSGMLSNLELRLPSMIVRRDQMTNAFQDQKLVSKLSAIHIGSHISHPPTPGTPASAQQRQAQKELWEKERKKIIQNASNNQGETVERVMAGYFAL
ncbi:hypothetical protein B7463_g12761, partial [Scytalidium lignicola]